MKPHLSHDGCFLLGKINESHGVQGGFWVTFDVDNPESYRNLEELLVDVDGVLVPYRIRTGTLKRDRLLIFLDGITSLVASRGFPGRQLYLPLSRLTDLGKSGYYFHELIGMTLVDEGKKIGKVSKIYHTSVQAVLSFEMEGNEVLVPVVDEIVVGVDKKNRIVHTRLPEGLVDIYCERQNES